MLLYSLSFFFPLSSSYSIYTFVQGGMVIFLLQTYTTDEVTAKAYNEVVTLLQSFAMTEEIYFRML